MSNEQPNPAEHTAPQLRDDEDPRREWTTPTISDLPVTATQGTLNPTGGDAGLYS
jgi:hypothetical protein